MPSFHCTNCSNRYEAEKEGHGQTCDPCRYDLLYGHELTQVETSKSRQNHSIYLAILIASLIGLYFIGSWSLNSGEPRPCKSTTKAVKDIHIVDGKVVEYDKQEVEGCVTDDGYFIPRPDY